MNRTQLQTLIRLSLAVIALVAVLAAMKWLRKMSEPSAPVEAPPVVEPAEP